MYLVRELAENKILFLSVKEIFMLLQESKRKGALGLLVGKSVEKKTFIFLLLLFVVRIIILVSMIRIFVSVYFYHGKSLN